MRVIFVACAFCLVSSVTFAAEEQSAAPASVANPSSTDAPPATEHAATEHHGGHEEIEEPQTRFEAGVGAVFLYGGISEVDRAHGGVGATVSFFLVPAVWAIELVAHAVWAKDLMGFPTDLLIKRDFVATEALHPYISLGVTGVPERENGEWSLFFGFASAIGADYWFTRYFGLGFEVNFNILARETAYVEVGAFVGPVLRLGGD